MEYAKIWVSLTRIFPYNDRIYDSIVIGKKRIFLKRLDVRLWKNRLKNNKVNVFISWPLKFKYLPHHQGLTIKATNLVELRLSNNKEQFS